MTPLIILPKDRIFVAMDFSYYQTAYSVFRVLEHSVGGFKLGLEAISAGIAHRLCEIFENHGVRTFWDGKLNDISETVGKSISALRNQCRIDFLTLHASVSAETLRRAAHEKKEVKLLVVTVLTDIDEEECASIFGDSADTKILSFAEKALVFGADGIVCSPRELTILARRPEFDSFIKVVPASRPQWAHNHGGHKRVLTPADAIRQGADYLVIGRPITQSKEYGIEPLEAVSRIVEEIANAAT